MRCLRREAGSAYLDEFLDRGADFGKSLSVAFRPSSEATRRIEPQERTTSQRRRKALKESFFANENARHLEKLEIEKSAVATKDALAKVSGSESDEMLDKLCPRHSGFGKEPLRWKKPFW